MSERVKLVNFLIRLHSLFPGWRGMYCVGHMVLPHNISPVLSWDAIIEILSEEDYMSDRADIKNESAYLHMVGFLKTYSGSERLFL
jgi:hypothetical protein